MPYKVILLCCLIMLLPQPVHGEETTVAIIYSSPSVDVPPEIYKLDALVSRFSDNVILIRDTDINGTSLKNISHVFYYGLATASIPDSARMAIIESDVPIYAIGHNVNQLDMFKQLELKRVSGASQFYQSRTGEMVSFRLADVVNTVKETEAMNVHASLIHGRQKLPILVQTGQHFYAGIDNLLSSPHLFLADSLFDFFGVEAESGHVGYLRLEDINPTSDPELVESVGDYLLDRNIPVLLAVIPIYTDADSGQVIRFKDRPELVDVLRHLESRGATVLAHGYTHQYRSSETGEGFEFWDVETNQPILVPATETPPRLKTREAFTNEAAYLTYIDQLLEGEATYVSSKLTKSIHELVTLGLHPLGFEAPHYTMSHSGYMITSEFFTNVFGQVQWSNSDWEVMGTTPYVSKPSLLHGMTLYPETIGYVRTDIARPVEEMRRALEEILLVRESMIGAFYHPYIGTDHLEDVVNLMESAPGFTWLDLRAQNERVMTPDLLIEASNDKFIVQDERSAISERVKSFTPESFLEQALLGLALITFIAISAFLAYTLYLRSQRKQRLFKERD